MANLAQLDLLRQGIEEWNRWRKANQNIQPDLSGADLSRADLSGIDLSGAYLGGPYRSGANLSRANFREANLSSADLREANFSHADLRETNFYEANLSDADLSDADLDYANLSRADLSRADLSNADLSDAYLNDANLNSVNLRNADLSDAYLSNTDLNGTDLNGANLSGAHLNNAKLNEANLNNADLDGTDLHGANLSGVNLYGANLHGAILAQTILGELDLRWVKGLETIQHMGPSHLSINTIYKSEGIIPEVFVRGTGAPDNFIEYMHTLRGKPLQHYTCFISYSSEDQAFAEQLYNDLQGNGIRCWFARKDFKPGDFYRDGIDELIKVQDKVLLILSEHSVKSIWIEKEVECAWEREMQPTEPGEPLLLFPIRLDETVMQTEQKWARQLRFSRHIGDFTEWKDYDTYQTHFQQLLHDLKQGRRRHN